MSLWIDLTDFLQWSGNLTGIQRIQFNISKLYIASGEDVKFFVYEDAKRTFRHIDFNPDEIVKSGVIEAVKKGDLAQENRYVEALGRRIKRLKNRIHDPQSSIPQLAGTSPFGEGDTVLVMGGIWVGTFIDDLCRIKQEKSMKLVHFAFDMIPSLFPGFVVDWLPETFTDYQKKVFAHAEGILAISESTAKDVRVFIKEHQIVHNPEIQVVRIGESIDELSGGSQDELQSVHGLDPGFILSVSTIEVRKNHISLLYIVREAKRRGVVLPKIVIAGRNGWQTDDFRYVVDHDPELSESIVIINDADDIMLSWLYQNCLLTIFPSFYEGWGMPVAESLAYGKLCIASDTSSMPEIAGDLIDYFSPHDTGAMLAVVEKYLDSDTLRQKEDQIEKQYKPTSWHQMFLQIQTFVDQLENAEH